jgi:hypothetical protein
VEGGIPLPQGERQLRTREGWNWSGELITVDGTSGLVVVREPAVVG